MCVFYVFIALLSLLYAQSQCGYATITITRKTTFATPPTGLIVTCFESNSQLSECISTEDIPKYLPSTG